MKSSPWVLISGGFHRNGGMDKANLALAEYLVSQEIAIYVVTHSADQVLYDNPLVHLRLIPRPLRSFLLGAPLLNIEGQRIAHRVTSQFPGATVVVNGSNCSWPDVNWSHYVHHAWPGTLHGQPYLLGKARAATSKIERIRERNSYRGARLVVANSNTTRQDILKFFSINPDRVKTVYLGSDLDCVPITPTERKNARASLGIAETKFVCLFLGSLGSDNRKGMDTLLSTWKLMSTDKASDLKLLVAGGGRCEIELQSEINKFGLEDRMHLLGFRKNVREILAASDLLISPARYEPYGLNVQEAICCGIPAFVSASAGVAERYPPSLRFFLLPDPENVSDLIDRIEKWQSSVEHWKTEFELLGASLRSHTWQHMAQEFVSVASTQIQSRASDAISINS